MASAPGCGREQDARSSRTAVRRGAAVCPHSGRPYTSLRGRSSFQRAFRKGQRRRAGPVTVIVAEGQHGSPRVGFVAGRNVGGAVDRNRAKRRLREAMARTELREGADYVVIASAETVDMPYQRLVARLQEATGEREGTT